MSSNFFSNEVFTFVIIPVLIFFLKVMDVTIGTMRILFLARGNKLIVISLGFFEVLISIIAIAQIMQNLNNPITYLAYAGGFSAGSYMGMLIEEKLAIGIVVFRIIIANDTSVLLEKLKDTGFGVTIVKASGSYKQNVTLIYTAIKRKHIGSIIKIINESDSKAFYTIEDARVAFQGTFPEFHAGNSYRYKLAKILKEFGTKRAKSNS
jgi:uncharacterized protein YebE (UPF0316 family)